MLQLMSLLLAIPQDVDTERLKELAKMMAQRPPILVTWSGMIPIERINDVPAGYVADGAAWKKVWASWRGNEPVPEVKFNDTIVIVAVSRDPNSIRAGCSLDDQGDLKFMHATTLVAFGKPTTSRYQFALIPRKNIKTINGQPIQDTQAPRK